MIAEDTIYSIGKLSLDIDRRLLFGPRGEIRLEPIVFSIMAKLMRRPRVIVEYDAMITSVWCNPDDEPSDPIATIRDKVSNLRGAINLLGVYGPDGVEIKCEVGVGYYITTRVRKS